MAGRLAGKVAFITAAGQGIGRAAALAFAREGAQVWATDLNAKLLADLEGKDGIRTKALDVTDETVIGKLAGKSWLEVPFNESGLASGVDKPKCMDAEPFHHSIAARDRAIRHNPHDHVGRFWRQ